MWQWAESEREGFHALNEEDAVAYAVDETYRFGERVRERLSY